MYKYTYMPTKTIYVSDQDAPIFEEARSIAGETLSSIIARSLREFLGRERQKEANIKEVSIRVGSRGFEQEQRFHGTALGDWRGFSSDQEWWMEAQIYRTQKANWAILLTQICKASLLTDKKRWRESGDYMLDVGRSDLLVGATPDELKDQLPHDLYLLVNDLAAHSDQPTTFLDI